MGSIVRQASVAANNRSVPSDSVVSVAATVPFTGVGENLGQNEEDVTAWPSLIANETMLTQACAWHS
jgi:hypothetical protein